MENGVTAPEGGRDPVSFPPAKTRVSHCVQPAVQGLADARRQNVVKSQHSSRERVLVRLSALVRADVRQAPEGGQGPRVRVETKCVARVLAEGAGASVTRIPRLSRVCSEL